MLPDPQTDSLVIISPAGADSATGSGARRVTHILVLGNVHTKARVILAELDFKEGDTLALPKLRARLEANRRRVFNLRLFHAVLCQVTYQAGGGLLVTVVVRERWYIFPAPIFSLADRNLRAWLDHADLNRVNVGLHLSVFNFRGRNERLVLNLQHGFNRKYEYLYSIPYFDRHRRLGFSTSASFIQSHSVDYATLQDKPRTVRTDKDFPIRRWYGQMALTWRRTIMYQTWLGLTLGHDQVSDTVLRLNPRYLGASAAVAHRIWLEVAAERTINRRDVFAYPLKGAFFQAKVRPRVGLTAGSPVTLTAYTTYARYWSLGHRFYYAVKAEAQSRLGGPIAYVDNQALGYSTTVRGYEQYVVDGQQLAVLRQGLSHQLLAIERLPLPVRSGSRFGDIPLALYFNLFTDVGLAADASLLALPNTLPNRFLGSVGIALHLVTYYDRVLRIEATLNARGQGGLFLATGIPI